MPSSIWDVRSLDSKFTSKVGDDRMDTSIQGTYNNQLSKQLEASGASREPRSAVRQRLTWGFATTRWYESPCEHGARDLEFWDREDRSTLSRSHNTLCARVAN